MILFLHDYIDTFLDDHHPLVLQEKGCKIKRKRTIFSLTFYQRENDDEHENHLHRACCDDLVLSIEELFSNNDDNEDDDENDSADTVWKMIKMIKNTSRRRYDDDDRMKYNTLIMMINENEYFLN